MSDIDNVIHIVKHVNPNFTDNQAETFAKGFVTLEENTYDFFENDDEVYRKNKLNQFDALLVGLGFNAHDPEQAEQLFLILFQDYPSFMFYIAEIYQYICPNIEFLKKISKDYYEDYMAEMANDYDDL